MRETSTAMYTTIKKIVFKMFTFIQISELNLEHKKKHHGFQKNIKRHNCFLEQQISISCNNEKSVVITGIKYILKQIQIETGSFEL